MRAPDAIMEPSVMAKINEYLSAGGQPQVAIESLSEHYEGGGRQHTVQSASAASSAAALKHVSAGMAAALKLVATRQMITDVHASASPPLVFSIPRVLQAMRRWQAWCAAGWQTLHLMAAAHHLMSTSCSR
jgi:hypothetical protein